MYVNHYALSMFKALNKCLKYKYAEISILKIFLTVSTIISNWPRVADLVLVALISHG